MSVCPFCKAQVAQSTAPCPSCGKLAADHPSIAAISGRTLNTDFDDDDHGELSLVAGSSVGAAASHAGMPYESGKGVTLDDDLFGDGDAGGPLELDMPDAKPAAAPVPDLQAAPPPAAPSAPGPAAAPSSGRHVAAPAAPQPLPSEPRLAPPPASSSGRFPAAPSSPDLGEAAPAPPPPTPPTPQEQAAIRIANYPPVPEKLWEAPRYAVRVLLRQVELRQDLASLRRRRSPDVALYERALAAHDPRMYAIGLAITGAAVFLALVLFFMPVIKRFAFAPD